MKPIRHGPSSSQLSCTGDNFDICCVVTVNHMIKCWGQRGSMRADAFDMHDIIGSHPSETGFVSVSMSTEGNFACALHSNTTVSCWGDNSDN